MVKRHWWSVPVEAVGIVLILLALVGFLCACSGCRGYGVRVGVTLAPPGVQVEIDGPDILISPEVPNAAPSPPSPVEPLPPPVGGVPVGPEAPPESREEDGNARLPPPPRAGPGRSPGVD